MTKQAALLQFLCQLQRAGYVAAILVLSFWLHGHGYYGIAGFCYVVGVLLIAVYAVSDLDSDN